MARKGNWGKHQKEGQWRSCSKELGPGIWDQGFQLNGKKWKRILCPISWAQATLWQVLQVKSAMACSLFSPWHGKGESPLNPGGHDLVPTLSTYSTCPVPYGTDALHFHYCYWWEKKGRNKGIGYLGGENWTHVYRFSSNRRTGMLAQTYILLEGPH